MVELWTPQGSTYIGEELAGYNGESGVSIVIHTFQFHDPVTDRSQVVKIPADPEVSRDHVEDMDFDGTNENEQLIGVQMLIASAAADYALVFLHISP